MAKTDIRNLLARLNPTCSQALQAAAGRCFGCGHYEVTQEHLLLELAGMEQGDWKTILPAMGLARTELARDFERFLAGLPRGSTGRPVFAPPLLEWIQDAWLVASVDLGEAQVRSGALLAAFLERLPLLPSMAHLEPLRRLSRETLLRDFPQLTAGSPEGAPVPEGPPADGALESFCVDFTRNAREGRIDPVFGRDPEIRQVVDILARRRKNNPICVGDPGVGKTALVEGLALRIVQGDVPDLLRGVRLLALDVGLLEAGASVKGEFENRLKRVIEAIKAASGQIVLFVDEAHTLIGAGGAPGGSDAANLLKPALARGELRTIAATTWTEYKKYFEKDPALARRFQLVRLQAPTVEETVHILRGIRPHYEEAHGVVIRDDALVAAADISDRHLVGRFLPDKAIDLLDTSCARIKVNLTSRPAALEDVQGRARALEREKEALERDLRHGVPVEEARIPDLEQAILETRAEAAALEARWEREREAVEAILELRARSAAPFEARASGMAALEALDRLEALQGGRGLIHHEVSPEVVAQVVSDWTGIPLGKLLPDQAADFLALEERLGRRIKGQDHALQVLAEGLRASKAGIGPPDQPLGVFLLVGPSGTGKTETALALADLLFGSERNVITLNMSEFQEAHSVSRLVGSPPGYVGYGAGGLLTEAVRQRPYSVVLLDEAEKAHGDVLNLFHQVFDKGLLTDGEGKEVSFRNAALLLTSNQASEEIRRLAQEESLAPGAIADAIRPSLARAFRPSLLARMTVVPYLPLEKDALTQVAGLKLDRLRERLAAAHKVVLRPSPDLVEGLVERCLALRCGARGIDFALSREVLPSLSREILARPEGLPGTTLELGWDPEAGVTVSVGPWDLSPRSAPVSPGQPS